MAMPATQPKEAKEETNQLTATDLEDVRKKLQAGLSAPDDNQALIMARRRKRPSMMAHALSGSLGSVMAELLLFPMDTVKLLVQTAAVEEKASFFSIFFQVLREKGVAGLYKGVGAAVLTESVHSFNYWFWHGLMFRVFTKADDTSRTPARVRLLLNLVAKQLNWLCTVPFEVVSSMNQLAVDSPGFIPTAVLLYREGGLGSFYRGLLVSMVLAINPAIMNTLITTMLSIAAMGRMAMGTDYETARDHGPAVVGFVTGMSKFAATAATYPLIRAKVLQQTAKAADGNKLSVFAIWRTILATEGPIGLYRGVMAMSYKTALWNSLMMMFKHALGPKRMITPPATPIMENPSGLLPPMPSMAREPFPADLCTAEKLDEILSYLKREPEDDRVRTLEGRLNDVGREVKEIKSLLGQLVHATATDAEKQR